MRSPRPLRVLAYTTLYPNAAQPRNGIFLEHRLGHLARTGEVELRVVAPVPWFPSADPRFGQYAAFARAPKRAVRGGIAIAHPRYPVIPKVGMTVAPALMAAATLGAVRRIRREFDFDVIDAFYLYPEGVAATLIGRALGVPVLLSALGTDVSLIPRYAAPRAQILWAARQAGGITTVCEALSRELVALGVAADHVRTVLHGVDLALFRPPADRDAIRARLGLAGPVLLSVGHLIERKGHGIAIAALPLLPEATLLIAGDGPLDATLRAQAAALGVTERVRFLGHVDQGRLPELFGAADVLVLCSDREGIANVLLEALACGTPVAATAIWGTPEIVRVPEAGRLLAARTPDALADAVRAIIADPADRAETRRYAERFSWEDTSAAHLAALRAAMASRPDAVAELGLVS
jgi:glycosyltransferase involved in cell wall biosynthesis